MNQGPSVIHAFFFDSPILAMLASRGLPIGLVTSIRQIQYTRQPLKSLQLRWTYPRYDLILANSHVVANAFLARNRIDPARVRVVYNGVQIEEGLPLDARIVSFAGRNPLVGIVANANRPVKRLDVFLKAAARVLTKHNDVRFAVVGGGQLLDNLKHLAQELGIAGQVLFAGSVSQIEPLVSAFTIGVLSSDLEGLPNAVLEYMALGRPTVATRVGGIPELLVEGKTGRLVPAGDPEAMACAINTLLENPDQCAAMGDAARRRAQRIFSMDAFVAGHLAAWRDALEFRESSRS